MPSTWSQPFRPLVLLLIICGFITNCGTVLRDLDDKLDRSRFKSDYECYEYALAVYKSGDYRQARDKFEALSTISTSGKLARQAWLGQICSQLMLADTRTDYTVALDMWYAFTKSGSERDVVWDMVLLDPLIDRMTAENASLMMRPHPPAAPLDLPTRAPASWRLENREQEDRQNQDELTKMKKKADRSAKLQQQLDEVVAENHSLKAKIKALEAIDQNIQKKKTEISAPGE